MRTASAVKVPCLIPGLIFRFLRIPENDRHRSNSDRLSPTLVNNFAARLIAKTLQILYKICNRHCYRVAKGKLDPQ